MVKSNSLIKIEDIVKILSYIIGAIGFLSVARHIGLFYSLGFMVFYLFSIYLEYRRRYFIPRWVFNIIALSFIIVTFIRMSVENFVVPSIEALLVLLVIKVLEEKKFRDYMQVYILSVFLLAGAALLSLDVIFLIYFVSLIVLLATTIVLLTYYSQDKDLELKIATVLKIVYKSLLIPLIAIPMTVFMFIILPRTSYPILNFLNRAGSATTGFTDTVKLGTVSNIQEDASIIFRAHMEKIDENLLYWRGVVLDYFDGASWKGSYKAAMDKNAKLSIPGRRIEQTIYLEPYENRYFFTLDKPLSLSLPHARRYSDLSYSQPEDITGRTRYQVISIPSSLLPEKEIDRDVYLQLPDRNFEKIKETVKGISSGKDKEATVKAILTFLRSGNYKYSLQNLPVTSDPLDDFLFKYRYGNCEYFASAMAVMLRIADIPSRIVGGYKGGYYNEMGRYYFVPQRNAHVWVEAYLENKGWVRVDPTPGGIESYVSYMRRGLLFRMRLLFDTINYYWNAAVINYDFEGQMALFGKLRSGIRKPDIRISFTKERIIRYSIFVSVAASSLFMVYFLALRTRNAEERLIASFLKKMGSLGYTKAKSEGLEEFVSKIEDSLRKEKAYNFVREFEKYYYLDTKLSKKEVRNLKQLIKNI